MKYFAFAPFTVLFALTCTLLGAQSLVSEAESIRVQREAIAQNRQAIMDTHAQAAKACWQKFAVNACLSDVRKARRTALEPLRQQDLVLNTQERMWRSEQRDLRLQGKQPDGAGSP